MFDATTAVSITDFDFSEESPTSEYDLPERDWALGSQPIPITEDIVHVRHLGEQTWHRAMAGSPSTLGYETACGLALAFSDAEWRSQVYRGSPCPECFTKRELARFVPDVASTWRHHLDGPHKKEK